MLYVTTISVDVLPMPVINNDMSPFVNWLVHGRFERKLNTDNLQALFMVNGRIISSEIAFMQKSLDFTYDTSTLFNLDPIHLAIWRHQATMSFDLTHFACHRSLCQESMYQ